MNRYPQTEKWMKYAIKRTNQITNENEMYHQDYQRVQAYYEELAKDLNPLQKELLSDYQDHVLMREEELALAMYIAAFEDVVRLLQNVSFMPELSAEPTKE